MIEDLFAVVDHFEKEGERRFARWDSALYRAFVEGPADALLTASAGGPAAASGAALVFEAYLRLVVDAIGYGYVDAACLQAQTKIQKTNGASSRRNLIEMLLVDWAPTLLPRAPSHDRIAFLAKAWNLAEGLLGEPAWLNRASASALSNLASLADLDKSLIRVLEAAALPRACAKLAGPFAVRSVDTREVDHAFLPGAMHFAAPAMLCVHDRKRPGVHAGVLLGAHGAVTLLGPSPCLGRPEKEDADLPTLTLFPGGLRVGDAKIPLSYFKRGHSAVASRAGFLVASALDSQRLWVVESP